jgi:hypothetical protein
MKRRQAVNIGAILLLALVIGIAQRHGFHASKADNLPAPTPAYTRSPNTPSGSDEYPVEPYTSSEFLGQLPWSSTNGQSFYLQPWRSYLETVPATQMLDGIGVNYSLPSNADDAVALKTLADSGFKVVRIEVGWGDIGMNDQIIPSIATHLATILQNCKQDGIKPLILLNANQGVPVPNTVTKVNVVSGGTVGATSLVLSSVAGLTTGYSGLSNLTGYTMDEVLFTSIDPTTNTVQLSKPLPKAIDDGTSEYIYTMKYLPLYPVGTPQFDATSAGWLKYVDAVTALVNAQGITDFDAEIWNELTFGSNFLNFANYYATLPVPASTTDFLHAGGNAWQLGNLTVQELHKDDPSARAIWGFSNTTFYHTAITQLPPGTGGQSGHPYGTGTTLWPANAGTRSTWFVDNFIPSLTERLPEGWAGEGYQVETLPRLLNPGSRLTQFPPDSSSFLYYMTEMGSDPQEDGITDPTESMAYKAKALIRSVLFWLNKGLSQIDTFTAYDSSSDAGFGLFSDAVAPSAYGSTPESALMSPALTAMQNVTSQFSGSVTLTPAQQRQLTVAVTGIGPQQQVFAGDATHQPLYYRDMFAFLPFQDNATTFTSALYVMSYDAVNPPTPESFRLTIGNVNGLQAKITLYDPLTGSYVPNADLVVQGRQANSVTLLVNNVPDYPWLLKIQEGADPTASAQTPPTPAAPAQSNVCLNVAASLGAYTGNLSGVFFKATLNSGITGSFKPVVADISPDASGNLKLVDSAFLSHVQDSSTYSLQLKPQGYLSLSIPGVTNILSQCLTTTSGYSFIPGDFAGTNSINLADIVTLIHAYDQPADPASQSALAVYGHTPSLSNLVTLIYNYRNHPNGS